MNSILQVVETVCRRLHIEPYLVGGTVRDRLVGRSSRDWDFVCVHAQRAANAVARHLSAKRITLDEQHRIYRIILPGGVTLDFAERQGKTLEQDLARRDFTINAMAMRGNLPIIDPFGGQKDLKKKILRAVSRKAFQDDPLRLLRAYRMMAQFDLKIAPQTARWIKEASSGFRVAGSGIQAQLVTRNSELGTKPVAGERVREELLRLLNQPRCAPALAEMDRAGLLTVIFPELEAGRRVGLAYYGKGGVVKHHLQSVANLEWLLEQLEKAVSPLRFIPSEDIGLKIQSYVRQSIGGYPRAAFLKLGALLHDIGKPATAEVIKGRLRFFGHEDVGAQMVQKVLKALRFSRHEGLLIRLWVRNHMRPGNLAAAPKLTDKAMSRFFHDLGEDGVGMLLVSLGDHYTYLSRSKWGKGKDVVERTARRLLEAYYVRRESVLPPRLIDGHAVMKRLHLKPGPIIGKLLDAIRDAQTEGKVKTAEEAVDVARKVLQKAKRGASPP